MSKILRQNSPSATVIIGDRHSDLEKESAAEQVVSEFFPNIELATNLQGKKVAPLKEFTKIKEVLDKVMNGSWERGNREGFQRGLREGQLEAARVTQEFDGAIKNAISERHRLYEDAKANILSLVIQISKKVTFNAAAIDQDITLKIICGVIEKLIDKSSIKIKVDPEYVAVIEKNIEKFIKTESTIKQFQIEGDARVKFGGCLIETPSGDIDARLESQFELVNRVLTSTGDA